MPLSTIARSGPARLLQVNASEPGPRLAEPRLLSPAPKYRPLLPYPLRPPAIDCGKHPLLQKLPPLDMESKNAPPHPRLTPLPPGGGGTTGVLLCWRARLSFPLLKLWALLAYAEADTGVVVPPQNTLPRTSLLTLDKGPCCWDMAGINQKKVSTFQAKRGVSVCVCVCILIRCFFSFCLCFAFCVRVHACSPGIPRT